MSQKNCSCIVNFLLIVACGVELSAGEADFQPYPIDWPQAERSAVDMSRYLEAPAGRDGFVRVEGKRLLKPNNARFRIWGVNLTGPDCFPPKELASAIAADLARFGVNCVRFHHMDGTWSPLFDKARNDTDQFDEDAIDRLDFFIAELKRRGIYTNLNLNVSRQYKPGDEVRDAKLLGYGKSATYFNQRLIELQHDFARKLLTHRNPYTKTEYRHEPAVCTVEMVNENSVLEGWVNGHGYWQHPRTGKDFWIANTPLVNDPLDSTIVQFARTPVVGRPFTISETNHPYPAEYACEGIPILTAYALFHDWDGIYWFTYGNAATNR